MKPIDINFAPPSLTRTWANIHPATMIAACLAAIVCISIAAAAFKIEQDSAAQQSALQRLHLKIAQHQKNQQPNKGPAIATARAMAINQAVAQLNLPWRELFNAMEDATPAAIALLSLTPDAPKQIVRLIAEARTGEQMIDYIDKLKQQALFDSVVLTRHEINEQDPNKPIRFQLDVHWQVVSP